MAMQLSMWVATHYRIDCTDSKDHNDRTTSDNTERLRVLRVPAHSFHFITVPTPDGWSLTRNNPKLTCSRRLVDVVSRKRRRSGKNDSHYHMTVIWLAIWCRPLQ